MQVQYRHKLMLAEGQVHCMEALHLWLQGCRAHPELPLCALLFEMLRCAPDVLEHILFHACQAFQLNEEHASCRLQLHDIQTANMSLIMPSITPRHASDSMGLHCARAYFQFGHFIVCNWGSLLGILGLFTCTDCRATMQAVYSSALQER